MKDEYIANCCRYPGARMHCICKYRCKYRHRDTMSWLEQTMYIECKLLVFFIPLELNKCIIIVVIQYTRCDWLVVALILPGCRAAGSFHLSHSAARWRLALLAAATDINSVEKILLLLLLLLLLLAPRLACACQSLSTFQFLNLFYCC